MRRASIQDEPAIASAFANRLRTRSIPDDLTECAKLGHEIKVEVAAELGLHPDTFEIPVEVRTVLASPTGGDLHLNDFMRFEELFRRAAQTAPELPDCWREPNPDPLVDLLESDLKPAPATYNDLREQYGLPRIKTFDEIGATPEQTRKLEEVYGDPSRIPARDYFIIAAISPPADPPSSLLELFKLVGLTDPECTGPGGSAEYAPNYITVANDTGGVTEEICLDDWRQALTNIGLNSFGLRRQFPLSSQPDPTTIAVTVDGAVASTSELRPEHQQRRVHRYTGRGVHDPGRVRRPVPALTTRALTASEAGHTTPTYRAARTVSSAHALAPAPRACAR